MIAAGKYRKVGLELCFFAGEIVRTVIFLVCMLLPGATFADSVRHLSVPERFWGIWAPSTDLCRDDKSIFVVSVKGYVTAQASCTIHSGSLKQPAPMGRSTLPICVARTQQHLRRRWK